ncbi:MAG: NUDIX domain-containing protein [Bacillota bacterium]|uniref:DNA mismatch repair protein MutT n=1 Tax=Cytobacillus oceanisediminis 2691 TaxID=1196031 RepID=A0A161IZB6_9BACI|nr:MULTISPECIES: NUDIX domain-containing protein [Bacillaceae]AND43205.1 DNA mismatch repair protein MutT [Cytobacillus oceanisediminis 2691]MBH0167182.1 NUDIX domain-containing protein [Fictibacillus sp. 7GRE50]MBH0175774.1 NUDIX domain-containing protein [Fictibacillus sp. 23RED33]UQX57136.1 NUDIX domain-containing protein [Cytobacillus pseudoceanisediminis]USK41961.1 NUDIX domain-containing protein [Cytobacillus oceanisediminis]
MDYCENMREMIGNSPLIIVRPSVAIMNNQGEILLNRYKGGTWSVPGGILQLNESVEECIKRNVQDDLGLTINSLQLFGVYSGLDLYTKLEGGEDEYHIVAIGYLCTDYEGEVTPDANQAIEAEFFKLEQLPEETDPFIKNKLVELKGKLEKI